MNTLIGLAVAAMSAVSSAALAQTPRLVMEEMMVPSEPGIEIYVRNKRPADMTAFRPERTVLYVHGATYPASTAFDLPLGGMSWMDYIAVARLRRLSPRPARLRQVDAAEGNVRGPEEQSADRARRHRRQGHRRGGRFHPQAPQYPPRQSARLVVGLPRTMATYTTQNPGKVERLVLYAPGWIRQTASLVQAGPGPLGAYRKVSRDQALGRWMTGVPEDKKATLIPAGWFDAWADATFATDPEGAQGEPAVTSARRTA